MVTVAMDIVPQPIPDTKLETRDTSVYLIQADTEF